ncbi:hypothetical protein [Paenibacillus nuruki]|uniref:hypothetical protein n=1 Tax=Paenibacillus nuruki TaxID=1886670 RepID=UPI002804DA99|nr:hypothetical protein [Paenibacillus nuruki]CAJ1316503.1 Cu-amine-oxidN1 domain-containing protein [Paenibacillus nuruki]
MKKGLLCLLSWIMVFVVIMPSHTTHAVNVKGSTYQSVFLFVNGTFQITQQYTQFVNNNKLYIPIKIMDRIPGITIQYGSPLTITGNKGSITVNESNSFAYAGVTYVMYKSLLAITDLDGKYASSAQSLFIWSDDEGKRASSEILTNISQLPAKYGYFIGQKIYPFYYPGAYWITNIRYASSSLSLTIQNKSGDTYEFNSPVSDLDFLLDSELTSFNQNWHGKFVWFDNRAYNGSDLNHLEKLTFIAVRVNDQNDAFVTLQKSNGKQVRIKLNRQYDTGMMLSDILWAKNPRTVYNWSNSVWTAISKNKLLSNMTREQVTLSWGEPSDKNTYQSSSLTYEQWIYSGAYLYFWNGRLSSAQSR